MLRGISTDSCDPPDPHQAFHLVTTNHQSGSLGHLPQLPSPAQATVGPPQIEELVRQIRLIQLCYRRAKTTDSVSIVGPRSNRDAMLDQHNTDRLDPEPVTLGLDVIDHNPSLRSNSADAKNTDAVLRNSLARTSRAFSYSNDSPSNDKDSATRTRRIQFRNLDGATPNNSPTSRRAYN